VKEKIHIILDLAKVKITVFVTITTVFGYLSYAGKFTLDMIAPTIGIFLLACGSAAINHYQERNTDKLMARTRNRPIPAGKISEKDALTIALLFVTSGSLLLLFGSGFPALGLGWLALIWYNVIYTPMKKNNALAIIPGSVIGAIPPVVGWVAAGGYIFDQHIMIIAFFLFIWQIPHFWLLVLVFGSDYEGAGFPTLTRIFTHDQLSRITFMWITAIGMTSILMPLFFEVHSQVIIYGLVILAAWLVWKATRLLRDKRENTSFRFAFREINVYVLLVISLLSIDKLI